MRNRGKNPVDNLSDFNYSAPDLICKIHPNLPTIGICPICLREKLNSLVCSVCGGQKTPSCSCSVSNRNSNSSDIGSVGRISFLIENEKQLPVSENHRFGMGNEKQRPNSKTPRAGTQTDRDREEGLKKSGFWRFVRMFRKKRCGERKSGVDERSEMWVLDQLGVSRSRSLCSFHESSSDLAFSSAKISDFNSSSERASNFSEVEPRGSSFKNKGLRESDFRNMDESAFIDLKLVSETGDERLDLGNRGIGNLRGGSCRITERDKAGDSRREKKGKKRVWGWILKNNFDWRSRSKKDYEINYVIRA